MKRHRRKILKFQLDNIIMQINLNNSTPLLYLLLVLIIKNSETKI